MGIPDLLQILSLARLFCGDKVENLYVSEHRFEDRDEGFVLRVLQIHVPVRLAAEGHDPAVGESLGQAFRADVGAVLEAVDFLNLSLQRGKFGHHPLYLFRRRFRLELELYDVTHRTSGESSGRGENGHVKKGKEGFHCEGNKLDEFERLLGKAFKRPCCRSQIHDI